MNGDLSIEFIAQHDHILELVRQWVLFRIAAVPNLCLAEEAERPWPFRETCLCRRKSSPRKLVRRRPPIGDTPFHLYAFQTFRAFQRQYESESFDSAGARPAWPDRWEQFGPGRRATRSSDAQ